MTTKKSLRIALLSAALVSVGLTGITRAADDTTKPAATPAPAPTPPANGGGRGGRGGANFNPADILKTYRDQFEGLKLTDEQMKKIDGFIDTCQTEVTKAADDRQAAMTAIRQLRTDTDSILTDEQKAALRLKRTQQMFDGVKTRYTADNLMLTDDQKSKITAICDDAKKEVATLAADTDPQASRQKTFQLMRDTSTKCEAVLTPDQVKLLPPQRGGPGGGQGGRGGRRGGGAGAGAPPANQ